MMSPRKAALGSMLALATLASVSDAAQAYVGPGLGAGALGAVLGVVGAVLLAVFAVIYYPIKRMLRRRKAGGETARPVTSEAKTTDVGG